MRAEGKGLRGCRHADKVRGGDGGAWEARVEALCSVSQGFVL